MIPKFIVPAQTSSNDSSNVTAVILAAAALPKMKTMPPVSVMMVDRQHTVLDVQIDAIQKIYPNCEILIVVGHDAQQVIDKTPAHVRIVEHVAHKSSGETEELRLALNNVTTDNILLINGNCVFNSDAIKHLVGHGSCTLVDRANQIEKNSLGVITNNSVVENIAYGVQDIWCHVSYLELREHRILKKFAAQRNRSNLCVYEGLNYVFGHGGKVYAVGQIDGYLRKITGGRDLL